MDHVRREFLNVTGNVISEEGRDPSADVAPFFRSFDDYSACYDCGHIGQDFVTVKYFEGDYDAECPKCKSTAVDEVQTTMRLLVNDLDTVKADLAELKERLNANL